MTQTYQDGSHVPVYGKFHPFTSIKWMMTLQAVVSWFPYVSVGKYVSYVSVGKRRSAL